MENPMKNEFELQRNNQTELLVIEIPQSLTVAEAQSFRDAFKPVLESDIQPAEVVLDFRKTGFLDSSGIGALASIIKMTKIAGIKLSADGMSLPVKSVLRMTRLDQLLSIEPSAQSNQDATDEVMSEPTANSPCIGQQ